MDRMPFFSSWLAIDVALGVREWNLLALSPPSGGLESYTNVSSESDESASSTALATFCSKMSALDDAGRLLVSRWLTWYKLKLWLRPLGVEGRLRAAASQLWGP
jgi:hypothetical protein